MTNTQTALDQDKHWIQVGQLKDIPVRGSRRVMLGDKRIALFRTRTDQVFAVEDKCPHAGGPLSDGIVHGNCVTCPLHNWVVSLETGHAQGADTGQSNVYAIRIEGEEILLNTVARTIMQRHGSKTRAQSIDNLQSTVSS